MVKRKIRYVDVGNDIGCFLYGLKQVGAIPSRSLNTCSDHQKLTPEEMAQVLVRYLSEYGSSRTEIDMKRKREMVKEMMEAYKEELRKRGKWAMFDETYRIVDGIRGGGLFAILGVLRDLEKTLSEKISIESNGKIEINPRIFYAAILMVPDDVISAMYDKLRSVVGQEAINIGEIDERKRGLACLLDYLYGSNIKDEAIENAFFDLRKVKEIQIEGEDEVVDEIANYFADEFPEKKEDGNIIKMFRINEHKISKVESGVFVGKSRIVDWGVGEQPPIVKYEGIDKDLVDLFF